MPAHNEKPFKVFYSWQSDLPECVNLKLIRNALSQASSSINADHGLNLHVVIDEATREISGSPNISDSIFSKLRKADVFVCDLSKVAEMQNESGTLRKYCNPNAAIELGYAVRVLGWNRIIIVFNEAYGIIPDDLPFDVRGHRTSTYNCQADLDINAKPTAACQNQIKNSTGSLRALIVEALKCIAKDDPKRPSELELKSPEVIQRERDIVQLKKVFYWINMNMMDRFITGVLNARLHFMGLSFCESLGATINSTNFYFYDATLKQLILNCYAAWKQCGEYTNSMEPNKNDTELRFILPFDTFISHQQEKEYNELRNCAKPLRQSFDALLNHVRSNYLEIDLAASGIEAVQKYLATDE